MKIGDIVPTLADAVTVLMPASEALRSLPSAQLTGDEHAQVGEILREINAGIRKQMKRNGFQYQTGNRNPVVAFEVVQRLMDAGYDVQAAPVIHPARLGLDGQPECLGFRFGCCPSRAAVIAARETERQSAS